MFIREKIKRSKGKEYIQHQLIESIRTPAGPRQNIILNMGKLDIKKDQWKLLANAIEEALHNQTSLFHNDPDINKLAQHYANLIIQNKLTQTSSINQKDRIEEKDVQYEMIDINSIKNTAIRSLGAEHIVFRQFKEYNLDTILTNNGFTESQVDYARILIASRLIHPSSERETARWINENSAFCELMETNIAVYDNALHRTAVMIWENHDNIEKQLAETAKDLFSLKEDVILYDLTNTYFEGSKRGSKVAKPGKVSKEKRNDRPLVTLALTIDEDGFPKKSRVLEGNVSEPGTLEHMLDQLEESFSGFGANNQKTIVIDAGIATDKNLKLIKGRGYQYIAVSRNKKYEQCFWDNAEEDQLILNNKKSELKIKMVKTEEERYLLCHSAAKEAKERAIYQRRTEKFENALTELNSGLKKKRKTKKYDAILERIGRLKEQYKVGHLYTITVKREKEIATDITFESNLGKEAKETSLGEYVLRTNRTDITGEEISRIHRSLTTIESSFKSMKSELGLRPNYHKNDDCTIAHIFITVIAYHILAGLMKKLRSQRIKYTWDSVRKILSNHVRVTSSFNDKNGNTIHIRNSSTPTLKQKEIYKALKLKINPLKRVKWILPLKKET
jgi:hypothetical protein